MKSSSFGETGYQAQSNADSGTTYSSSTVFPAKVKICVKPITESVLLSADQEYIARGSKTRTISSDKTPDSN